MIQSPLHVFVYGTLKPGEANFDRYCASRIIAIEPAYINGDLYELPQEGYPAISNGDGKVYGFILAFDDPNMLTELDELEEYYPHQPLAENIYSRQLVAAYTSEDNDSIPAWVYLMTIDRIQQFGGIHLPNGWWQSVDRAGR
jgi:gamma-glutamylcyclotransferase (GGCT)/AIG2-like uncharacterized protein YtfP